MSEKTMADRIADLEKRRDEALHAGAERSIERQRAKGKMLARERIDYLLDAGSFHELDMLARHRALESGIEERPYTDGVVTGGEPSMAAKSFCSPRTSPCSVGRWVRCSPRRSTK